MATCNNRYEERFPLSFPSGLSAYNLEPAHAICRALRGTIIILHCNPFPFKRNWRCICPSIVPNSEQFRIQH